MVKSLFEYHFEKQSPNKSLEGVTMYIPPNGTNIEINFENKCGHNCCYQMSITGTELIEGNYEYDWSFIIFTSIKEVRPSSDFVELRYIQIAKNGKASLFYREYGKGGFTFNIPISIRFLGKETFPFTAPKILIAKS